MNTTCKNSYIDISVPLSNDLPVWPGGYGFYRHHIQSIGNGSDANVTRLDFDVHSGTHIDAPLHFIENGKQTTDIPLDCFIGDALVLYFEGVSVITVADLETKILPANIKRILIKTDNSKQEWYKKVFDAGFTAIDNEAAKWLVKKGVILLGIDGPSIQKYHHSKDTHVTLLQNQVVILEGLNLLEVTEGVYQLICLPVKAANCEGISARAILKRYE